MFFWGELITFIPTLFLGMSGMPRRINDYPEFFIGWHSWSSMGHALVVLSLFIGAAVIIESKYVAEKYIFRDKYSSGVPFFSNRLSLYFLLVMQSRRNSLKLSATKLHSRV